MRETVQDALADAYGRWAKTQTDAPPFEKERVSLEPPPAAVPGDLATNLPLSVAKLVKKSPRQVAQEIMSFLPKEGPLTKTEIAGPGFLNFFFSSDWLTAELRRILAERGRYGRSARSAGTKILLEFVSANPTGPLHVGHGRGAALGDSLARVFRHRGYPITTEYYINNVGTQTDNLAASVMLQCEKLSTGYLTAEEKAFAQGRPAEDLYPGAYVRDVAAALLKKNPAGGRPTGTAFFRDFSIDALLGTIRSDLKAFDVSFDQWYPESRLFDENKVDAVMEILRKGGHIAEAEGALWFRSTAFGDDKDRVLTRKDERPTYFASDIAYHHDKLARGFGRLIDVWGADHHGYVARVKAALRALGHDPDQLTILLNQLVSLVRGGKPVAMGKRSGEFVTLAEVVNEVGKNAARFFFALRGPNSQLEFDLDLAKKQASDNPVFYVSYVHARCCSIFREAEKRGLKAGDGGTAGPLGEFERALLVKMASFPDVLDQCLRELSPHPIPSYLLSLSGEFHRFYEHCRVLDEPEPVRGFRLALVDGVRTVIKTGLALIGVDAPEEM